MQAWHGWKPKALRATCSCAARSSRPVAARARSPRRWLSGCWDCCAILLSRCRSEKDLPVESKVKLQRSGVRMHSAKIFLVDDKQEGLIPMIETAFVTEDVLQD